MDKRSYFLAALKAEAFRHKHWVLSVFSVKKFDVEKEALVEKYPYQIVSGVRSMKGYWSFLVPGSDPIEADVIEGSKGDEPIYSFKEKVSVSPGDLPNIKTAMETTYGNLLVNAMVLCWPFGDKVDYINGPISAGKLDQIVSSRLEDTPPAGAERSKDKLYVDELIKYCDAMAALAGLATICAPAATPKTMTIDPAIIRRRNELLKENQANLHDPAVIAAIEKELVAMDRATFKGDPAEAFYIKDKTFNDARKRCFIIHGTEAGFGDPTRPAVITNSLQEGWNPDKLPAMADSLRAGSFNRGAQTALGGESVKYFYRIFQNTKVIEEDCGVDFGLPWDITEKNFKTFIGQYGIFNKKTVRLDEALLKSNIGKKIYIRSPMVCKSKAPSFCARCVGDVLASTPTGLHVAASDVGSTFMGSFMSSMHTASIQTARYNARDSIN